jgi:hypothetical protein
MTITLAHSTVPARALVGKPGRALMLRELSGGGPAWTVTP